MGCERFQQPSATRASIACKTVWAAAICLKVQAGMERASSIRGRLPGSVGSCSDGPTQEPAVTSFAAKRPNENHGQNFSFEHSSAPCLMNSFTVALRAVQHSQSPLGVLRLPGDFQSSGDCALFRFEHPRGILRAQAVRLSDPFSGSCWGLKDRAQREKCPKRNRF
jgi:hypothetical protein